MNKSKVSDIVNFVIQTELEQFKKDFDEALIPYSQDISSLSIAWLCHYCKENVSSENSKAITLFVDEVMKQENFNHHGWMRIAALQAAAYSLTSDEYYLNHLLQNVACHQSSIRVFILHSVSIIVPLLSFENEYLKEAVEFNVNSNYGCADESILLLLSTTGEAEMKSAWIKNQLEIKKTNSTELLEKLLDKNAVIENEFYKTIFNEVKSSILFRVLKHSYSFNNQMNLFDNKKVQPKTLNSFLDDHPLNKTKFDFKLNHE